MGLIYKVLFFQPRSKVIAISSITKFEIEYGLIKKPSLRKVYQQQLEEIYRQTKVLEFNTMIAIEAAKIRDELVKAVTPIGLADLLISAIARHHRLIIVTSNIKHFAKVRDLPCEDWRYDKTVG